MLTLAIVAAACTEHAVGDDRPCGVARGDELSGEGAGSLRVGATFAEVARACAIVRDTVQLDEGALPQRYVTVRTRHGDATAAVDDAGRVWRVSVDTPGLRTRDSLGVGATLAALLRRPRAHGGEGEGGLFVEHEDHCGLTFRLAYAVPDAAHHDAWTVDDLRRLPPTTRVDQVLAVGCSSSER